MRTFGQAIYDVKKAHPDEILVCWKSDVSSAFLNLPAHSIYQLWQVVNIDGSLQLIHCLVFGNLCFTMMLVFSLWSHVLDRNQEI